MNFNLLFKPAIDINMEHVPYNYSNLVVVVISGRSIDTCRVTLIFSRKFIREAKVANILL